MEIVIDEGGEKMLKIVTVDKNAFHYQPAIFLTDTIEVEREFINLDYSRHSRESV